MTRRSPFPLVTFALVVAIVATFAVELAGDGMCERFGFVAARPGFAAALSSLLLHDPTSPWHVLGNLALLVVFGSIVERAIGALRFFGLYVACGLAGAGLHVVVDPGSTTPLVGASGALFGVLAVAGALYPRLLGFVVAFGAINVLEVLMGTGGSVAVGAHIGGFACGVLLVALARLRERAVALAPV